MTDNLIFYTVALIVVLVFCIAWLLFLVSEGNKGELLLCQEIKSLESSYEHLRKQLLEQQRINSHYIKESYRLRCACTSFKSLYEATNKQCFVTKDTIGSIKNDR